MLMLLKELLLDLLLVLQLLLALLMPLVMLLACQQQQAWFQCSPMVPGSQWAHHLQW